MLSVIKVDREFQEEYLHELRCECFALFLLPFFLPGELGGDAIITSVLYDIGQRLHSLHGWLGKYFRQSHIKRSGSTVLSVYIRSNDYN